MINAIVMAYAKDDISEREYDFGLTIDNENEIYDVIAELEEAGFAVMDYYIETMA